MQISKKCLDGRVSVRSNGRFLGRLYFRRQRPQCDAEPRLVELVKRGGAREVIHLPISLEVTPPPELIIQSLVNGHRSPIIAKPAPCLSDLLQ